MSWSVGGCHWTLRGEYRSQSSRCVPSGKWLGGILGLGRQLPQLIDSGPDCWQVSSSSSSFPWRCRAVAAAGTVFPKREASCHRALLRRNGLPRPGWRRQLRRRAQRRASHPPCSTEGQPNAIALTAPASKRHKGKWSIDDGSFSSINVSLLHSFWLVVSRSPLLLFDPLPQGLDEKVVKLHFPCSTLLLYVTV